MIAKSYIASNLREINSAFRSAASPKYALYFSKLAILELCGWIELSMDDIVRIYTKRVLSDQDNVKFVEENFIKRNYGFAYDLHFRRMMIQVLGIGSCEFVEKTVDVVKKAKLEAQLSALHTIRNSLAHTYVIGTTTTIDAPSVTIVRFNDIYEGLKDYERCVRAL